MNRLSIAALAMLALLPALAYAAQIVEPVVPKGLSDTPMDAPAALSDASPPPRPAENERRAQRDADARQCLTLPTNRQIHACAEHYRTRVARARAAKAAKTSAAAEPAKAEVAKPADTAKGAQTSKPADTAKGTTVKPPQAAKAPPEPPKTSDVIKLPPLKPVAPAAPTPGIAPKAPEPTKK